jgi:hypothetical protein
MDPPMHLKLNLTPKSTSIIVILVLLFSSIVVMQAAGLQLTTTSEYTTYVHTNINSAKGNYTLVEKPIFPVMINNSQIQIGGNWTIICPLQANHNYHVYFYGAYINTSSQAKTDYDIYVFNPQGTLESTHTEAAGLPEHLGTNTSTAFFTPTESGNYSFIVQNNPVDSASAQQATFMIIENLETDQWYTSPVEGAYGNNSNFYTNWAYEFVTNASKVQLYIKVAQTLDMYEARLYLMNSASSPTLNSVPLPWEPGLYGNLTSAVGGYNFVSNGYRGVTYASCEYNGQSMFLNYTSPNSGANLYHLVLIGEVGSGTVEFMLKTKFGNTALTSLGNQTRVQPNNPIEISYISNNATLEKAQLSYSTSNWTTVTSTNMDISNRTCNATIPGQRAGSNVLYRVVANDVLNNNMTATGNFTVKTQPALHINIVNTTIILGKNVTVTGTLTQNDNFSKVKLQFFSANTTETINCNLTNDGTFNATFRPSSLGTWAVTASSPETQTSWRADSGQLSIKVNEPPFVVKYSLYIIIGVVVASAVGGAVWFLKFREK